jgi:hypothetical protein
VKANSNKMQNEQYEGNFQRTSSEIGDLISEVDDMIKKKDYKFDQLNELKMKL